MGNQQPDIPPAESVKRSKIKLVILAVVFLSLGMTAVVTGWLNRERVQALGGPLHVEVFNESGERVRADVYVGPTFATLELDPGEQGMVRFTPREESPVEIRLFQEGELLKSIEHGSFKPGVPDYLAFHVH